jgi:hypothetical protein
VAIARWVAAAVGICLSLYGMLGLTRMLRNRFLSGDYRTLTFEAPWLMVTSPLFAAVLLLLFRNWVYAALMVFPVAWWLASIPLMSPRGHSDNEVSVALNVGALQQVLVWASVGATSIAAAMAFTRLLADPHTTSRMWWWPAPLLAVAAWVACRVANLGVSLVAGALGANAARRAYRKVVSAAPPAAAESPQPAQRREHGLSVASIILGGLSLATGMLPLGIPAVITGAIALRRGYTGRTLAIWGVLLGSFSTLLLVVGVIVILSQHS